MEVSNSLKHSYSNQYDLSMVEWRNMAAKYKALNIIELSKKIKFENVLEVGAGEGSILHWLSKYKFSKNMYAIEISNSGIEIIKSKHIENLKEVLLFDGYKIPYKDNQFDLLIGYHL